MSSWPVEAWLKQKRYKERIAALEAENERLMREWDRMETALADVRTLLREYEEGGGNE